MSTTTHVSHHLRRSTRLADQAKGLPERRRCLASSPPSRAVSLANPLAVAHGNVAGQRLVSGMGADLQIHRFLYGHPEPFISVRDLGRLPPSSPVKYEESLNRSSVWLPAWFPHGGMCPRRAPSRSDCGPCAPPLPPIGLTAARLFAGGKVSRTDSRVR